MHCITCIVLHTLYYMHCIICIVSYNNAILCHEQNWNDWYYLMILFVNMVESFSHLTWNLSISNTVILYPIHCISLYFMVHCITVHWFFHCQEFSNSWLVRICFLSSMSFWWHSRKLRWRSSLLKNQFWPFPSLIIIYLDPK